MKKIDLIGVNAIGEVARVSADVVCFTDTSKYFSVSIIDASTVKLVTPKGSYVMSKHPTLNIYQGTLNGHKAQVVLKKIIGTITYW